MLPQLDLIRHGALVCMLAMILAQASCVAGSEEPEAASTSEALHGTGLCDAIAELDYHVRVGDGVRLHVLEKLSARSIVAWPRRAIVLLPPTLATNAIYEAEPLGDRSYDAMRRLALEGYLVFAPSYEGYGESTAPEDGSTVTAERILSHLGTLIEWIHFARGVHEVDLMGMSLGSALAVALGGDLSPIDRDLVGRIVLTSHLYEIPTPFFQEIFLSPEVLDQLASAPGGYIETQPFHYAPLLSHAEPEVLDWAAAALPGRYATGPTLEGFDLPVFEASFGRAPALQVWGDEDPVTPPEDVVLFQGEYGGPARSHVIAGGGHSLILEPTREQLWTEVISFLHEDRPAVPTLGCDLR